MSERDALLERLRALDPATDERLGAARADADPVAVRDRITALPFEPISGWRRALSRRPGPTVRRSLVIVTALAIAVAGIVVPIRLFGDGPDEVMPSAPADLLLTTVARPTGDGRLEIDVATIDLETGALTVLPTPDGDEVSPVWSPDGSSFAFARDRREGTEIVLADADGSGERVLAEAGSGAWTSLTWSPDGTAIAVWGGGGSIELIDVATGERSTFGRLRELFIGGPIAWSPDGSTIALVAVPRNDDFGLSYLYAVDADGSNLRRLVEDPVIELRSPPAWSPDGRTLVYQDVTSELAAVDLASGGTTRLTDGASDGPGEIVGASTAPAFSPDGSRIAFLRNPEGAGFQVWIMRADGSAEQQITEQTDIELASLSWRPAPVPGGATQG